MYIGTALLFSFYLVEAFARETIDSRIIELEWGSLEPLIPRTFYLGNWKYKNDEYHLWTLYTY